MRQIIISIETAGVIVDKGLHIIEMGGIELVDGEMTGSNFHFYINPQRSIDDVDIERHGITDGFLSDKPLFEEIVDDFLAYIGEAELIIYDSSYVLEFLNKEIKLVDRKEPVINNVIIDVLSIANKRHLGQSNTLQSLYGRYGIDSAQSHLHGALLEAELITDLFLAIERNNTKHVASDLGQCEVNTNKCLVVKDFPEFDQAIEGISKTALCRGVSNREYSLLPSLFRHEDIISSNKREENLMWVFKTHAKAHLNRMPTNEVEWLTIAQHHGLPTRLLDWSLSPLVACFFAVQSLSETDALIYIYDIGKFQKEEKLRLADLNEITAFFPSHATQRVTAQSGMFTIHPASNSKLESQLIKKIIIPGKRKKYFLEKLVKFGIHHATMFPDLDGLSSYIKYQNEYR